MNHSTPGLPVHHQLPEFTQTHVHRVGDAIQPSHLLLSPSPPTLNLSQHQGFPNESALHIRLPKYWSFSFSISPSNEYSGLISFRMDWFDLLAVQGTLKSLLQHRSSKASILRHSDLFIVQLSHPNMTTGKTIALTRWAFADKVMSLLFNMLSRLVITFLPRSKCLLNSWLQSPSAVILEHRKIKSATVSTVSPSICHEVMGPDAMIPHVQGKKNPRKMIGTERGHQRADRLNPQSQKTNQSEHTDHSLVQLSETKPCRVGPPKMDGSWWRGLTECGPLEKGVANHFSILALRTP